MPFSGRPKLEAIGREVKHLLQRAEELKRQRDSLNDEARKWVERRNLLHLKIKELKDEAFNLKLKGNETSEKIKGLKELRSQILMNRREEVNRILKLKEELKVLEEGRPKKSEKYIRDEIERLEWKIQTTPMTAIEERPIMGMLKKAEAQLKIYERINSAKQTLIELRTKVKALDVEIKHHNEQLAQLIEESKKLNEEMLKRFELMKSLKVEADEAHKKFLELKQGAHIIHEEYLKVLNKVKELNQMLKGEMLKREMEVKEAMERAAVEKLKRKEKLTWEEFQLLVKKGLMNRNVKEGSLTS